VAAGSQPDDDHDPDRKQDAMTFGPYDSIIPRGTYRTYVSAAEVKVLALHITPAELAVIRALRALHTAQAQQALAGSALDTARDEHLQVTMAADDLVFQAQSVRTEAIRLAADHIWPAKRDADNAGWDVKEAERERDFALAEMQALAS
jgi:hypothetical protein